ncbi:MAG: aspartate aminotransferase family protein [Thermoproteota archaeon]
MPIVPEVERELEELWSRYASEYTSRTPRSRTLYERARRVLPGGVTYHIRYFKPYPIFVARAEGSTIWDVDGNVYDDYWMGHGTHVLGHAPSFVLERVADEMKRGTHPGFENELALEYAELLAKAVPNLEMVRFTNSGTEANMYALRLARAYTKRRYVVKMEGGWHGGYSDLHTAVSPPFSGPEYAGILEEHTKYTIAVPFNDAEALERVLKRYDVAAVIVEPVLGAGGCIEPEPGYLREVRRLTHDAGALLIFDEVITGFRLALGGGQEFFRVDADLVTLGKVVGGGFPGAGAFGGKAEIMELLDHIKHPNPSERSFHGGTFTGNTVTMAAGIATVSYLYENRSLYDEFNDKWARFADRVDRLCEEHGRICWVTGAGSMIGIHFTAERPKNARQAHELRWSAKVYEVAHVYARVLGILYVSEHMMHLLPSMVHTDEQREKFISYFSSLLESVGKTARRALES